MEIFNVLLADDDYLILQNLQKLIDWNKCGFRIIGTASNGKEAVKLIKKEHPAVLITDVIMPVMNGLELVSQVRKETMGQQEVLLEARNVYKSFGITKALKGVSLTLKRGEVLGLVFAKNGFPSRKNSPSSGG